MSTKGNVNIKKCIYEFAENMTRENMYNFKKGDGVAYCILYILIPVIITYVSLSKITGNDETSIIYCYITILVSVLNSMYDGANRWDSKNRSFRNTKLFIILFFNAIIAVYCIVVVLCILISSDLSCRRDMILFVYFGAIAVSFYDMAVCFFKDMALRNCVGKNED